MSPLHPKFKSIALHSSSSTSPTCPPHIFQCTSHLMMGWERFLSLSMDYMRLKLFVDYVLALWYPTWVHKPGNEGVQGSKSCTNKQPSNMISIAPLLVSIAHIHSYWHSQFKYYAPINYSMACILSDSVDDLVTCPALLCPSGYFCSDERNM